MESLSRRLAASTLTAEAARVEASQAAAQVDRVASDVDVRIAFHSQALPCTTITSRVCEQASKREASAAGQAAQAAAQAALEAQATAASAEGRAHTASGIAEAAHVAAASATGAVAQLHSVLLVAASHHHALASRLANLEAAARQPPRVRAFPAAARLPPYKVYLTGAEVAVARVATWFGLSDNQPEAVDTRDRAVPPPPVPTGARLVPGVADCLQLGDGNPSPAVDDTTSRAQDTPSLISGLRTHSGVAMDNNGDRQSDVVALPHPDLDTDSVPSLRYLVLHGIGGVGKTTVAGECVALLAYTLQPHGHSCMLSSVYRLLLGLCADLGETRPCIVPACIGLTLSPPPPFCKV